VSLGEFELIERFFRQLGARRADVVLGVGDDAAVVAIPPGKSLVAAVDTLVEGIHFPRNSLPRSIGHRALAVNLSDIAAMGAKPTWALLALTMPTADESWLAEFAAGLGDLARRHDVAVIGGDTTSGPLTVSVTILGLADNGAYLARSGGAPGDRVFVSGAVGEAAAGLAILESRLSGGSAAARELLQRRFLYPEPQLELGARLNGIASAAIDISDGTAGDIEKLARASGCGARIDVTRLPLSQPLLECAGPEAARDFALSGGDDYELCFTVPQERVPQLSARVPADRWPYREVGVLTAGGELEFFAGQTIVQAVRPGYDHFGH